MNLRSTVCMKRHDVFIPTFTHYLTDMKKTLSLLMLSLCFSSGLMAQKNKKSKSSATTAAVAPAATMSNETDSVSYALGILVARNMKAQGFDSLNSSLFTEAMNEVLANKEPKLNDQTAQMVANGYAMKIKQQQADKNLKVAQAYLEKNKTRPGVITTPSGLQYEVITDASGPKPGPNSEVTAHYHGTLPDGTIFDSSVQRGQPFKTPVGRVIRAWQEALQLMSPGMKIRLYCPPELAYGTYGSPPKIGPNQVLIFEMELLSIDKP